MSLSSLREKVFSYVQSRYGSDIEYLWRHYPNYAVFRHKDNLKWYGLVMNIPRNKLGLRGNEVIDILNVKTDSTQLADILRQVEGDFDGSGGSCPLKVALRLHEADFTRNGDSA